MPDWDIIGNRNTNAASNFVGTLDNQPLAIRTNSVERLRITADGSLGIGTTTPHAKLHVSGGGVLAASVSVGSKPPGIDYQFEYETVGVGSLQHNLRLQSPNAILFHTGGKPTSASTPTAPAVPTPKMIIRDTGAVGIGTTTPGANARLHVVGGALAVGPKPETADAAIHVSASFGGHDRLLQASPDGVSKPGLNILASTNAAGDYQWWAWGVTTENIWRIQSGTWFGGPTGLTVDANGRVAMGALGTGAPGYHIAVISGALSPADVWHNQLALHGSGERSEARLGFSTTFPDGSGHHTAIVKSVVPESGGGELVFQIRTPGFGDIVERGRFTNDGRLQVPGEVHSSDFYIASDARLKSNVRPLERVLERLGAMRGVTFDWADDRPDSTRPRNRQLGVIAQEVSAVFPELVSKSGMGGYQAVDYSRLSAVLIEAVKELRAEKDGEIAALRAEIATMRAPSA